MEEEIKKAIRKEFLTEWVQQASVEEIVEKLIENDERAKEIAKLKEYIKVANVMEYFKGAEKENR